VKLVKIKVFFTIILALGIIITPYFSFAENEIQLQENEISVTLSPENPGPYQDVTVTLSSYATDLNKATIIWLIGGNTVASGIGKTTYTTKTGNVDSSLLITVNISSSDASGVITKKIAIYPSEIEIMWESDDGYTPPFYKGKSLPVKGSHIKVVAIPNTRTIQSGNGSIVYTWKNNDSTVESASGYNKNSYAFKNSMFDDTSSSVTVTASSVDGRYSAQQTVNVPISDSRLIFYEKSPTEGILYNNALTNGFTMTEDEMTIVAEPYFMTTNDDSDSFSYTWKINGDSIDTPTKENELTIRPTSHGGYATIGLTIENLSELFQKISNNLRINI